MKHKIREIRLENFDSYHKDYSLYLLIYMRLYSRMNTAVGELHSAVYWELNNEMYR